jgi:hypothetical protein
MYDVRVGITAETQTTNPGGRQIGEEAGAVMFPAINDEREIVFITVG